MRNKKRFLTVAAVGVVVALVTGAGILFDNYVRYASTQIFRNTVLDVAAGTQAAVDEAVDSLNLIATIGSSLCNSDFLSEVSERVQRSVYVRQILVENLRGAQYCGSPNATFEYTTLTSELPIPGRIETLSAIQLEGASFPLFKITRAIDHTQTVSALVNISHILAAGGLPGELQWADDIRIEFTDGTSLLRIGGAVDFDYGNPDSKHIWAEFVGDGLPIRVMASMDFDEVWKRWFNLYLGVFAVLIVLGSTYLFLALKIIRNMKAPAFDLEYAIASGEIRPYYQPVIDLSTGKLAGCEMLARWVKPDGEIISPGVFIDYAEVTGLAVPMTISLMEQVKQDLGPAYARHRKVKVAINLFAGHFNDMTIVDDTKKVFENSSISMDQLVFEITERYPLGENSNAIAVIAGLRELGCRLALDDVGTGHCNLAHVQNLGVDIIKIDQVFVGEITSKTKSSPVLDGLVRMAHELGSGIVAEGVETKEQAAYLIKRGVKEVQGFLFSPAVPAEKYIEMLDQMNGTGEAADADNAGETADADKKVVDLFAA